MNEHEHDVVQMIDQVLCENFQRLYLLLNDHEFDNLHLILLNYRLNHPVQPLFLHEYIAEHHLS